jgi:hypothetical protein
VGKLSKFMPQRSKETSGKRWSDSIHSLQFKFIHQNMSSCQFQRNFKPKPPGEILFHGLKLYLDFFCSIEKVTRKEAFRQPSIVRIEYETLLGLNF